MTDFFAVINALSWHRFEELVTRGMEFRRLLKRDNPLKRGGYL